jgi:hypothetical protein
MTQTKSCEKPGETLPTPPEKPDKDMSLQDMIDANIVESVVAGEVCSISMAKELGIFDRNNYYTPPYKTLKTFNSEVDARERRNQYTLCSVNLAEKTSTPSCALIPSAGLGYVTKKGFDKCIVSECPPGFEEDIKDPTLCKKPLHTKTVLLNKRNDERWYDWFTVPNYHLGNKYSSSNDVHFKPCGPNQVPYYSVDPVDGESRGFVATDETDRCISKSVYFAGKYKDTLDYCPSAMIKRMGSSKAELKNDYLTLLKKENLSKKEEEEIDTLYKTIKEARLPETKHPSVRMKTACSKMEGSSKLRDAYRICEQLVKNEKSFENKFEGETPAEINMRKNVVKYHCHELFSQDVNPENPAGQINKGGISFSSIANNPQQVEQSVASCRTARYQDQVAKDRAAYNSASDSLGTTTGQNIAATLMNIPGPASCSVNAKSQGEQIGCEKEKANFFHHLTKTSVIFFVVTIIIIVVIIIWFVLRPLLFRLKNWIWCRLSRRFPKKRFICYNSAQVNELLTIAAIKRRL